ncbi:MAG: hypothetical protein QOJ13_2064 [Gaiellales bacterium]|nr:hypothetical protein [Gaiellales bacterium]
MTLVHWDDIPGRERIAGDIHATWVDLGTAAGSDRIGLNRVQVEPGRRSTPAHIHGAEEEIFYVLDGWGLLWQDGATCEVHAGDAIVHVANRETHTLRAGPHGLDVLAFGQRVAIELCHLPRAGYAWAGPTVVASPGRQNLFRFDDEAGEFAFPAAGKQPANVVALDSVPRRENPGVRVKRDIGRAAGSKHTGLNHVTAAHGHLTAPPHCHSAEEELFVVLEGEGVLLQGDDEHPVRTGDVVGQPPGTGVAHSFRAGENGIAILAYGTREPNDICYYPRSGKVFLRGVGVIGRIEPVDYWDGEEL